MARRIVLPFLLLVLVIAVASPEVYAQKKKSPKEQVAPQTKPVPAFREWLAQQLGVATNRGTLQKVGPDYFIVEEDGVQTVIPIAMVQSIKVKKEKPEEEDKPEQTTLVIKLVSGD